MGCTAGAPCTEDTVVTGLLVAPVGTVAEIDDTPDAVSKSMWVASADQTRCEGPTRPKLTWVGVVGRCHAAETTLIWPCRETKATFVPSGDRAGSVP
jgi:hypothetical protein